MSQLLLIILATMCGVAVVEGTTYYLYSCPLSSSRSSRGSSSSSSSRNQCSSRRKRYAPYGIEHTYIQIGTQCYDWGNWNHPRQLPCSHPVLTCCVQRRRLKRSGDTSCADRVNEFESRWKEQGRTYHWFTWNCQRYSNLMKQFLNTCDLPNVSFK